MPNQKTFPDSVSAAVPLAFRPVSFDKTTLSDRVYETLRRDILANRLPPGTPLQEETLAKSLEVSRGPIREAIRRLASEGLASVMPRRGAVVSSLSREEFLNAYQVREALEIMAIKIATPRLKAADLDELTQLHETMERAAAQADTSLFFDCNAAFHLLFVTRSSNRLLQEMYAALVDQMGRYRMRSMTLRGGMQRSCEEHRGILEAVVRADPEAAARLLSEHIQIPQRILASSNDEGELELAAHDRAADAAANL
jgi:DNA-binding GntR family transcriptional regulator